MLEMYNENNTVVFFKHHVAIDFNHFKHSRFGYITRIFQQEILLKSLRGKVLTSFYFSFPAEVENACFRSIKWKLCWSILELFIWRIHWWKFNIFIENSGWKKSSNLNTLENVCESIFNFRFNTLFYTSASNIFGCFKNISN